MEFNRKKIITILLVVACVLSGIILAGTPPYDPDFITTNAELDSLITLTFNDHQIGKDQIRTYTTEVDSTLIRKTYRVRVTPSFSKTSLHIDLHKKFYDYGFETPARIIFPEKDMNIYFTYRGTVLRTIRLITDESLVIPTEEQDGGQE